MAAFKNFSGIRPRASDIRLAVQEAVHAEDVDLRRGFLRPRAKQKVWSSTKGDPSLPLLSGDEPQTLYRFITSSTEYWMYWENDVDVAPGPVDSDDNRRYYTGDGVPKMFTEDSVADTTPPYPGSPDTKYPFTWYQLGVPAPTDAPDIDEGTLVSPSEGSTGLITKLTSSTLLLYVNGSEKLSTCLSLGIDGSAGRESLFAGVGTTNIRTFHGGSVPLTCFSTGLRVRVTSIVDADHVEIAPAGRLEGPIEDLGSTQTDPWRWDNALSDTHRDAPLTRLSGGNLRKSFFCLDNTSTLEILAHTLREGDIIRVTGSASPLTWASTTSLITAPVPSDRYQPGNVGFRTLTQSGSADFEFDGTVSFVIERDGAEIDPVVPATAAFDISVRSYVYTYVSALGEESAPSPPTDVITVRDGNDVKLESFVSPPTTHRNIDRIWIYRSNTGSNATAFQFVGELAVADIASGFTDSLRDEDLDEALETDGWDTPRSDMHSIVAMPNGIMAGLTGNRLCFSVPGFPHAWPREYEQFLDFDGVGLEVFGSSLYVVTKGKPYIVTGSHPLQMTARRIESLHPGIDKRSIVNTGARILYASREGLISGGDDGFMNITADYYTKEQWLQIVGPDYATNRVLRGWYFDSQYVFSASYEVDTGGGGSGDDSDLFETKLIFDFRDGNLRITTFTEIIAAAFSDPHTSELYFVTDVDSPVPVLGSLSANHRQILRWDYEHPDANVGTEFASGDWQSSIVILPRPMSLSCAQVTCRRVPTVGGSLTAHGQVELTLYGRRYAQWPTNDTPDNDEILLINSVNLIDGQPGVGGWAGEQLNAPFRIDVNTLVDAIYFIVHVEGPVEVENVQFSESIESLDPA